jgi:KDO2-lipid IV(A) lauroyltransferase
MGKRSVWRQRMAYVPAVAALGIARALPWRARIAFGGWLGRRIVLNVPKFRRRIEANLVYVMPELDKAARDRIARETGDNFGRSFLEIFSMAEFRRRRLWGAPQGPGVAAARTAQAEGRPVLLVTGHFGQWEAGRAAAAEALGREVAGIYRPLNNALLDGAYVRELELGGRPMFPKGAKGLRGLVGHLSKGGAVAMLVDQYDRRSPVLDFVGRPAPSLTLAAELALRTGAVLIPGYGVRAEDGLHMTVTMEAPVPHSTAKAMTQALNDSLAAQVRAHPGQYFWLHRRWRKDL